jgi:hypothetical protein
MQIFYLCILDNSWWLLAILHQGFNVNHAAGAECSNRIAAHTEFYAKVAVTTHKSPCNIHDCILYYLPCGSLHGIVPWSTLTPTTQFCPSCTKLRRKLLLFPKGLPKADNSCFHESKNLVPTSCIVEEQYYWGAYSLSIVRIAQQKHGPGVLGFRLHTLKLL